MSVEKKEMPVINSEDIKKIKERLLGFLPRHDRRVVRLSNGIGCPTFPSGRTDVCVMKRHCEISNVEYPGGSMCRSGYPKAFSVVYVVWKTEGGSMSYGELRSGNFPDAKIEYIVEGVYADGNKISVDLYTTRVGNKTYELYI